MVYILDQLYIMKSKVQQLEKKEKEMKKALTSCERRIQVIETRKFLYKAKRLKIKKCFCSISLVFQKVQFKMSKLLFF